MASLVDHGPTQHGYVIDAVPAWVQAAVAPGAGGPPAWRIVQYGVEFGGGGVATREPAKCK
jgi:hypothetical protein